MQVSSLLHVRLDEDGTVLGLKPIEGTEFIASSVLPEFVRNSSQQFTTVSGSLLQVCSTVTTLSSAWGSGGSPSAAGFENWNSNFQTVSSLSGNWESTYSTVLDNSGSWAGGSDPSAEGFQNWNSTYTTVLNNSGGWESVESTVNVTSGNWQSTYNTVLNNSGGWETTEATVTTGASNWNSAYNSVLNGSGNWASSVASSLAVYPGSSIAISGFGIGDSPQTLVDNDVLVFDAASNRFVFDKSVFKVGTVGTVATRQSSIETVDMLSAKFELTSFSATNGILRTAEVNTTFTTASDATVTFGNRNITVSTCPIPNPFCYVHMQGNGTNTSAEVDFGSGVSIPASAVVVDSTSGIIWNETNKNFEIYFPGVYHILACLNINSTSNSEILCRFRFNGQEIFIFRSNTLTTDDPEEITVQYVHPTSVSGILRVTQQDDNNTTNQIMRGSNVFIRRLA